MTDLATFGFSVDSSQAAAAADNLDRMAGATDRASASSQGLVTASARLTAEIAATAAAVVAAEAAHRRLIDASDGYARAVAAVTSATSAFGRAIADVVAEMGRSLMQFEMVSRAVGMMGSAFSAASGMIVDAGRSLAAFGAAMADHLQRTFPATSDAVVRLGATIKTFAADLAGTVSEGFAAMYRASGPALEALGSRANTIFQAIATSAASAQAVAVAAVESIIKRVSELTTGLSLGGQGGTLFGGFEVSGQAFTSLLDRMREAMGKLSADITTAFGAISDRIRPVLTDMAASTSAAFDGLGVKAAAFYESFSTGLAAVRDRMIGLFRSSELSSAVADAGRAVADGAGSFASQAGRIFEGLSDTIARVVAALKNAAMTAAEVAVPISKAVYGVASDLAVPAARVGIGAAGGLLKAGLRVAGPVGDAMMAHDVYEFLMDRIAALEGRATEAEARAAYEQASAAPARAAYRTAAATAGITGMGVAQQYDATSAAGQLGIDPNSSVQAFARIGMALKDASENGVALRELLRGIGLDANAFNPDQSYGLLEAILHRISGLGEGDKASFIAKFFGQNSVQFVQGLTENTEKLSAATDKLNKTLAERDEKIRQAGEAQKTVDQYSSVVPLVSGDWAAAFHFAAQGDLVTTKKELEDYNRKRKEVFDQDLADKQLIMAEYDRRLAELNKQTAQSGAGWFGRFIGGFVNAGQAGDEADANTATVAAGGRLGVAPPGPQPALDVGLASRIQAATGSTAATGQTDDRIRSVVQPLIPLLRNGQITIDQARQYVAQQSAAYGGAAFVGQAWEALGTTQTQPQIGLQAEAQKSYDAIGKIDLGAMSDRREQLSRSEAGRTFLATLDSGVQDGGAGQAALLSMAGAMPTGDLREAAEKMAQDTEALRSHTEAIGKLNDQIHQLGATVDLGKSSLQSLRDVADKQAVDAAAANPLATVAAVANRRDPYQARIDAYNLDIRRQREVAGGTTSEAAGAAANLGYLQTPEGIQDTLGGRNQVGMLQEKIDEARDVLDRMNAARGKGDDEEQFTQQQQIINRLEYQLRSLQDPAGRQAENLYLQADTLDNEGFARRRAGALRSATLQGRARGTIAAGENLSAEDAAKIAGGYDAMDVAQINQIGRQMTRSTNQTADFATATQAGTAALRDMEEAWKIELEVARTDIAFKPQITELIHKQTEAQLALARAKADTAARQEIADQELLAVAWGKGAVAAHEAQLAIEGLKRARAEGFDRGDDASAAGQRRIARQIADADAAKRQASFNELGQSQRKEAEAQHLDYSLLGSDTAERAKAVEIHRTIVELQEKGADLTAEGTKRYVEQAGEISRVKTVIQENTAFAQTMAQTIGSSLEKAFADPTTKAKDLFKSLGADIQRIFFHEAIGKRVETFITGSIGKLLNPDIQADPGAVPVAARDPGSVDRMVGMMRGQIALTDSNAIPVKIVNPGFKDLDMPKPPAGSDGSTGGTVVSPRTSGIPESQWISKVSASDLDAAIEKAAAEQGIDPDLLRRVIGHESGWNPNARGSSGEIGYSQLMPDTAKGLGVDPYDWKQNVSGGARYLKKALDDNEGDTDLALTQYNRGAGGLSQIIAKYGEDVDKWPAEMRKYFESVDDADEAVRGFASSLKDATTAVAASAQGGGDPGNATFDAMIDRYASQRGSQPIVINRGDGGSETLGAPSAGGSTLVIDRSGGSGITSSAASGIIGGATGGARAIAGGDWFGGASQLFGTAQRASGSGMLNMLSGWGSAINQWGADRLGIGTRVVSAPSSSFVGPMPAVDSAAGESMLESGASENIAGPSLTSMGGSAIGGAMAGFSTGYAIGGMIGTKTGSRAAGVGTGALSGAASGAMMGAAAGPYGAAIGAAAGAIAGALGGGLGTSKPSNFGIGGSVDLSSGTVSGWSDRPSSETQGWQRQFVDGVNSLRDAITRSGAGTLSGSIGYDIGSRDKNSVTVGGVKTTVEPGDVTGMLNAVAKALPSMIQGASTEVATALKANEGQDFATIMPKITFAANLKTAIEDLNSAAGKLSQQGQIAAAARKPIDDATTSLLQFLGAIGAIYGTGGDSRFSQYGFNPSTALPSATKAQIPITSLAGFATGSGGAAAGWAWVGEAGPELVLMKGGETVLPHEQSLSMARRLGGKVPGYEFGSNDQRGYSSATNPGGSSFGGSGDSSGNSGITGAIASGYNAIAGAISSLGQRMGLTDGSGNATAAGSFIQVGGSMGALGVAVARALGWATGATGVGGGATDGSGRNSQSDADSRTLVSGSGARVTLSDAQVSRLTDAQRAVIANYFQYSDPGPTATKNQVGFANQVTNDYNKLISELQNSSDAQQSAADAQQSAANAQQAAAKTQDDAAAEIRRQALAAAQTYARGQLAATGDSLMRAIDPTAGMTVYQQQTTQIKATFDAFTDQFKKLGIATGEVTDKFKQVASLQLTTTTRSLLQQADPTTAQSQISQLSESIKDAYDATKDLFDHLGLGTEDVTQRFTNVAGATLNTQTRGLSEAADPSRAINAFQQQSLAVTESFQAIKLMFQRMGFDTGGVTSQFQGVARTSLGAASRDLLAEVDPIKAATGTETQAFKIQQTFAALQETFKALGLTTTEVNAQMRAVQQAMAATFNRDVANQVQAIQQPFLATLRSIDEEQVKAKRNAIASGGDMVEVEKLYAEKRRVAFEQTFQSLLDWVKAQAIGAQSTQGPEGKMNTAQAEYERLLKLVQAGDTSKVGQLQSAASTYLQTARDYYASSPAYGTIYNRVTGSLQGIADTNNPAQTATSSSTAQQQAVSTSYQNQQTTTAAQQQSAAVQQQQQATAAAQAAAVQQAQRNQQIAQAVRELNAKYEGLARNDAEMARVDATEGHSDSDSQYMHRQHDEWVKGVNQWKALLHQLGAPGYALGGWVTNGAWNKDSVNARLAGGEFVMPAQQAARFAPELQAMHGGHSNDNTALIAELRGLRQDVQSLIRVSAASGDSNDEGLRELGERLTGIERQTRLQGLAA